LPGREKASVSFDAGDRTRYSSPHLKKESRLNALTPFNDCQSADASMTCCATAFSEADAAALLLRPLRALAIEAVRLEMALEEGDATFEEAPLSRAFV